MGKLSRGITYQPNEYITAAKLYALIDTAIAQADAYPGVPSLYDVVMGDLLSTRAFHVAASPASPATNDLMVGSDGLLDRWSGSAWADLAVDFVYFVNNTGITLVTGTPVVADAASAANVKLLANSVGPTPDPLGVSMGVYANGATAAIQTRGLALVRVNSPLTVAVNDHLNIPVAGATALSSTASIQNDVLGIVVQTDVDSPLSGVALAILVH